MSIFAEVTEEGLKLLEEAGHAVVSFVSTEAQKVVNLAKDTHLYTEAMNAISNAESTFKDKSKSGAEKMAWVVQELITIGTEYLANGGWSGIFAQVSDFLRALVQLVFNDVADNLKKVGV